ncbi:hypothetical protein [Bradyrhizobium canariense]|uniref:hypothetical protein n=1 Tax=Bradyrhizobium canariense TaxID=255045 RepID=UPI001B8A02BB|nr:hypothetical protein [Bradyrhizobium canariense]MBR0954391.1 hypothetical protein [Bradyrhizobium canariense]
MAVSSYVDSSTHRPKQGFEPIGTCDPISGFAFEFKWQTTMAFNPQGLQCTITIPLSKRALHTPAAAG